MTEVIRKAVAQIQPGVDDAESPHGTFEVILSDATLDRDGESLDPSEWITPLPDHITFDIDHSMNVAGTVGSGQPRIGDDGKMYVAGSYSSRPLAQEVRALVNEGHIRTTSVAFLRRKDQKSGQTKRELLNGAFVAVPANPSAVILASKAFDPDHEVPPVDVAGDKDPIAYRTKAGARNSTSDASRLQQIHDLSVDNGAMCAAPDGKAVSAPADEAETEDETPEQAIASVDAVIDQAIALLQGVDTSTLPENVQQALALLTAADEAVDDLMEDQGIPDPDEDATKSVEDDEDALYVKAFLMGLGAHAA
jgi:hypothetical protein